VTELETKWAYAFKNSALLERALTHKSFAHELGGKAENNEKLEFLGDAVLDVVLGEYLMELFPEDSEGSLSKKRASLVNEEVLSKIAVNLELPRFLKLGKGELATGGKQKPRLLASAYEALVGAVFLDSGFEAARSLSRKDFVLLIEGLDPAQDFERDYKTRLQEVLQKEHKEAPSYELVSEEGPPHDRHFQVMVKIKNETLAQGAGRSKKMAEQAAAKMALDQVLKGSSHV
jgi:ribonuclease-3